MESYENRQKKSQKKKKSKKMKTAAAATSLTPKHNLCKYLDDKVDFGRNQKKKEKR